MLTPAMATVEACGRGRFVRGRAGWATTARLALLTVPLFGLSRPGTAEAKDEARAITVEARDFVTDAPVPDVRLQLKLEGEQDSQGDHRRVGCGPLLVTGRGEGALPQGNGLARGLRPTGDPLGLQGDVPHAARPSPLSNGEGDDYQRPRGRPGPAAPWRMPPWWSG